MLLHRYVYTFSDRIPICIENFSQPFIRVFLQSGSSLSSPSSHHSPIRDASSHTSTPDSTTRILSLIRSTRSQPTPPVPSFSQLTSLSHTLSPASIIASLKNDAANLFSSSPGDTLRSNYTNYTNQSETLRQSMRETIRNRILNSPKLHARSPLSTLQSAGTTFASREYAATRLKSSPASQSTSSSFSTRSPSTSQSPQSPQTALSTISPAKFNSPEKHSTTTSSRTRGDIPASKLEQLLEAYRLQEYAPELADYGVQALEDCLDLEEDDFAAMPFKPLHRKRFKFAIQRWKETGEITPEPVIGTGGDSARRPSTTTSATRTYKDGMNEQSINTPSPVPVALRFSLSPVTPVTPFLSSTHPSPSPTIVGKNSTPLLGSESKKDQVEKATDSLGQVHESVESSRNAYFQEVEKHLQERHQQHQSALDESPRPQSPRSPRSFSSTLNASTNTLYFSPPSPARNRDDKAVSNPPTHSPRVFEEWFTPEGYVYYQDKATGRTQWEVPPPGSILRTVQERVRHRLSGRSSTTTSGSEITNRPDTLEQGGGDQDAQHTPREFDIPEAPETSPNRESLRMLQISDLSTSQTQDKRIRNMKEMNETFINSLRPHLRSGSASPLGQRQSRPMTYREYRRRAASISSETALIPSSTLQRPDFVVSTRSASGSAGRDGGSARFPGARANAETEAPRARKDRSAYADRVVQHFTPHFASSSSSSFSTHFHVPPPPVPPSPSASSIASWDTYSYIHSQAHTPKGHSAKYPSYPPHTPSAPSPLSGVRPSIREQSLQKSFAEVSLRDRSARSRSRSLRRNSDAGSYSESYAASYAQKHRERQGFSSSAASYSSSAMHSTLPRTLQGYYERPSHSRGSSVGPVSLASPELYEEDFDNFPVMSEKTKQKMILSASVSNLKTMGYADPRPDIFPLTRYQERADSMVKHHKYAEKFRDTSIERTYTTPPAPPKTVPDLYTSNSGVEDAHTSGTGLSGKAQSVLISQLRPNLYSNDPKYLPSDPTKRDVPMGGRFGGSGSSRYSVDRTDVLGKSIEGGYAYRHRVEMDSVFGESVYARLTDHRGYTGMYRRRFDADGRGMGRSVREMVHPLDTIASFPTDSKAAPVLLPAATVRTTE